MVTFEFYKNTYLGSSISESDWPAYEAQAAAQLRKYKRKYTVTAPEKDAENMAVCAMADVFAYYVAAQNGAGAVTSASIGSVSVSYAGAANSVDLSPKGQEKELYRTASLYLDFYRGVGGC